MRKYTDKIKKIWEWKEKVLLLSVQICSKSNYKGNKLYQI